MKIKDFTITFEAGEFKDNVLEIITFNIKQRTKRELNVEKTDKQITVTVPGEMDFHLLTGILDMIKYWKNVQ